MGSKKSSASSGTKKKSSAKSTKKEFHVSEHALVPTHEILSEEEVEKLYDSYDIDPTNLPAILGTDAALKGLGAKMGDVIKITRPSATAKTAVYYRRVAYE